MGTLRRGLLDTSVLIAADVGRSVARELIPAENATTVITLAELRMGVLAARDDASRARRLDTLESLGRMAVLDVDDAAAR